MKMTKKIMLGVVAAAAIVLTGCANLGDAKTSGTKWSKTFKLDATGDIKTAEGEDALYSRAFAALSASKKCSAIETEISIPVVDKKGNPVSVVATTTPSYAVTGLAFDVHLVDGKYDFVLVGIQAATGRFYVEKYSGVSKDKLKESMMTKDGNIDTEATVVSCDGKAANAAYVTGKAFPITSAEDLADPEKGYSWKIGVTQETAGTYVVKINDEKVATYTRELTADEKKEDEAKAYGQIFMYGNAPKDIKFTAKYKSNKDATVGLFADDEE